MVGIAEVEDDNLRRLANRLPDADELIRLKGEIRETDGLHIDALTLEL